MLFQLPQQTPQTGRLGNAGLGLAGLWQMAGTSRGAPSRSHRRDFVSSLSDLTSGACSRFPHLKNCPWTKIQVAGIQPARDTLSRAHDPGNTQGCRENWTFVGVKCAFGKFYQNAVASETGQ